MTRHGPFRFWIWFGLIGAFFGAVAVDLVAMVFVRAFGAEVIVSFMEASGVHLFLAIFGGIVGVFFGVAALILLDHTFDYAWDAAVEHERATDDPS